MNEEVLTVDVGLRELAVRSFHRTIAVRVEGPARVHDLTEDARRFVEDCGIEAGVLLVHSLHTTAGLLLNECETGLLADFRARADALVPRAHDYLHDDMTIRWENLCPEDLNGPNGHAHLQHALFGAPSLTLPIVGREVVLGTWQRLLLIEYDRPRARRVFVQALGTTAPSRQLMTEGESAPGGESTGTSAAARTRPSGRSRRTPTGR